MSTETPSVNYKVGNERLIKVTDKAANKLASLLEQKGNPNGALRLAVVGGGCSGLQYEMTLGRAQSGDAIVECDGVKLFVDDESARLLRGATLDYHDALTGAGFQIVNPNAARTCGCGSSFEPAPPS